MARFLLKTEQSIKEMKAMTNSLQRDFWITLLFFTISITFVPLKAALANYTLTATPGTVPAGVTIAVTWSAPAGSSSRDWIGLYRVGETDNTKFMPYAWRYTNGATSGSFIASATPGAYEFRYLLNDGFIDVKRSSAINVTAVVHTLAATPSPALSGEMITVAWTAPVGSSSRDWIGLYPAGESDNTKFIRDAWQYTNGAVSGSFVVNTPLTPGTYEFRYLLNDWYIDLKRRIIVVQPTSFNFTLSNGGDKSVTQGESSTNPVTATLTTGNPPSVLFSVSGLPPNAAASFSSTSCQPTCSNTLTISTSTATPTGIFPVTVTGTSGSVTRTTSFSLTVNPAQTAGRTFYVATNGNDSRTCQQATNASTPRRTINAGVICLTPGDTLLVRAGTYAESLIDNIPGGTSWDNAVTVAAYPGNCDTEVCETVTLRPPLSGVSRLQCDWTGPTTGCIYRAVGFSWPGQRYIIFDGFVIDAVNVASEGIKIDNDHIRLKNLEIKNGPCYAVLVSSVSPGFGEFNELINVKASNSGWDYDTCFGSPGDLYLRSNAGAFYINGASNTLVDRCEIFGGPGGAISIYKDSYPAWAGRNNIIRNCRIYNNGTPGMRGGGINVSLPADPSAPGNLIYNNLIYDNIGSYYWAPGISLFGAGHNTRIYNNTIYNNPGAGIVIFAGISGVIAENNILYGNSEPSIDDGGVGTFLSNNLITDPLFLNGANGDFRLQAGSPAIDAGVIIDEFNRDFAGVPRPQGASYSIGAYEFVSAP